MGRETLRNLGPITLFAVLAGGLSSPAAAQRITTPYRFVEESQSGGVFAGYVATGQGDLELGPESAALLGLRYSIRLNGPFTLEAEAGFMPTTRTVWELETTETDTSLVPVAEADLSLLLLSGSVRFNLTGPRTYYNFMPYFLFAGGVAIEAGGDDDVDAALPATARFDFGTSFAGQLGGGVEWFVTRRLGLRADARILFWQVETPEAFVTQLGGVPDEQWVQSFFLSAGAAFHF